MHWNRDKKNYLCFSTNMLMKIQSYLFVTPFTPFHSFFFHFSLFLPRFSFQCHSEFRCNSQNNVLSAWTWSKLCSFSAKKKRFSLDFLWLHEPFETKNYTITFDAFVSLILFDCFRTQKVESFDRCFDAFSIYRVVAFD